MERYPMVMDWKIVLLKCSFYPKWYADIKIPSHNHNGTWTEIGRKVWSYGTIKDHNWPNES